MKNPSLNTFVNIATSRVKQAVYDRLFKAMKNTANMWWIFFVEEMNKPKHGRTYYLPTKRGPLGNKGRPSPKGGKRKKSGLVYTASAENEYPATVTGQFLELLRINVSSYNPQGALIRITINSGAEYTQFLIDRNRLLIQESKEDFWEIMRDEIIALKGKTTKKR